MLREQLSKRVIEIITSNVTFTNDWVTGGHFRIEEDSTFEDLGLDSLDTMEIMMQLEEEFDINININDVRGMGNLSDLIDYVFNKKLPPVENVKK